MQKTGLEQKTVEFGGNWKILSITEELVYNLDKENCPMKCIMKNKGCQSDYDGTKLANFGSIISFATTEILEGQVSDVCVTCSNIAIKSESDIRLI